MKKSQLFNVLTPFLVASLIIACSEDKKKTPIFKSRDSKVTTLKDGEVEPFGRDKLPAADASATDATKADPNANPDAATCDPATAANGCTDPDLTNTPPPKPIEENQAYVASVVALPLEKEGDPKKFQILIEKANSTTQEAGRAATVSEAMILAQYSARAEQILRAFLIVEGSQAEKDGLTLAQVLAGILAEKASTPDVLKIELIADEEAKGDLEELSVLFNELFAQEADVLKTLNEQAQKALADAAQVQAAAEAAAPAEEKAATEEEAANEPAMGTERF